MYTLFSLLAQGMESATRWNIILSNGHDGPNTGSDLQEAVVDVLTATQNLFQEGMNHNYTNRNALGAWRPYCS